MISALHAEPLRPDGGSPKSSGANEIKSTWWSLKPLTRPPLPKLDDASAKQAANPIDLFILAKLREKGLSFSPAADKRTLIRRLSFDLTGLPPTPEEIDAFLEDNSAGAYEKLIDQLLKSPRYGERWGRHWLDVVHYGDTQGYDKDQPRPNAWPYRDYVIRAFNEDRPYARFVQEQIAGDVLFPGTVNGIEALGFIAAGPWDLIGHAEVPESKTDGKIARHLDRDDMVGNTMLTFASTTVQCAQCHNHKFDPITQEDYYSLQAVFAALDRADRKYYREQGVAKKAAELELQRKRLLSEQKTLAVQLAKTSPELAALEKQIAELKSRKTPAGERPEFGYHSGIEARQDVEKWVQVDLGSPSRIDSLEYVACHDNFNNIGAGFGFPVRFKIEIGNDPAFREKSTLVFDRTREDVLNPGVKPEKITIGGRTARYIRFTALKLAPRQNDFIFALAELSVFDEQGKNIALGKLVTSLDSIEAPPRWRRSNLVDGYYYGRDVSANQSELIRLDLDRRALIAKLPPDLRDSQERVRNSLKSVERDIAHLPAAQVVYAGTVYSGGGAFSGTGANGGKPRPIFVLKRGDVNQPLNEANPGSLSSIAELPSRFNLPPQHSEGERRAALAKWLTDAKNPLTWRSIVNRVWRYHFGRGIVDSPNDFGRMGQLPTHPELLDWLAVEFRDQGQSLKKLHKLIVMSACYRQSSNVNDRAQAIDADNAYYARMNRRRLEAEAIRDSVLFVSGKLDEKLYGPAFQDFLIEKPEHSPHYQYHLHDPEDPRTHRRSVYRFLVRSQQQPFMAALDCADPSMQVDKRNETLSALQALALLNNGFMLSMSKHLAERLAKCSAESADHLRLAFRLCLARNPDEQELRMLVEYQRKHGLANACRLIFNLNEFTFVD